MATPQKFVEAHGAPTIAQEGEDSGRGHRALHGGIWSGHPGWIMVQESNFMTFSFGQSEREKIVVDVLSYERDVADNFHDYNWISITIFVTVGRFTGTVCATIITEELVTFHEQLRVLYDTLQGSAKFTTLEQQLALSLVSNPRGNVQLKGRVLDRAGVGNQLLFTLEFDQISLAASIKELGNVIKAFPVR